MRNKVYTHHSMAYDTWNFSKNTFNFWPADPLSKNKSGQIAAFLVQTFRLFGDIKMLKSTKLLETETCRLSNISYAILKHLKKPERPSKCFDGSH